MVQCRRGTIHHWRQVDAGVGPGHRLVCPAPLRRVPSGGISGSLDGSPFPLRLDRRRGHRWCPGAPYLGPEPGREIRSLVFDTYQQIEPRQFDPNLPVRIVDIDEELLKRIGQWPWPRTVLAELVQKLSENGAVAIGFDFIFAEPDGRSPAAYAEAMPELPEAARQALTALPSNDSKLAASFGHVPVVVAMALLRELRGPKVTPVQAASIAMRGADPKPYLHRRVRAARQRSRAAAGGPRRRPRHALSRIRRRRAPRADDLSRGPDGLSDDGHRADPHRGGRPNHGRSHRRGRRGGRHHRRPGRLEHRDSDRPTRPHLGPRVAPRSEALRFGARRAGGHRRQGPARGAARLIGTSAVGLLDIKATPIERGMPGVEVHAQLIENILFKDHICAARSTPMPARVLRCGGARADPDRDAAGARRDTCADDGLRARRDRRRRGMARLRGQRPSLRSQLPARRVLHRLFRADLPQLHARRAPAALGARRVHPIPLARGGDRARRRIRRA